MYQIVFNEVNYQLYAVFCYKIQVACDRVLVYFVGGQFVYFVYIQMDS